jgi:hypothetical protein
MDTKKILLFLITALALVLFFSYKLTSVPSGITIDEASFGYNGVLLARTLHDENNRKLPIFVLSIGGSDWRQPVTQYLTAATFKVFGPSLMNLKMVTVVIAVSSIFLLYFLAKHLLGNVGAIVSSIFLATTPIFMVHSHLALDNIAPVPFVILWLLGLYLFTKSKKKYWLIISAVALGISYYSYKSMRIFVPIWTLLSLIYLAKENLKKAVKPILFFSFSILPFFAVIPVLEYLYAGAVLNKINPEINSIYTFVSFYFSNFDPSFLYVKGDVLLFHSTGRHGMYLLASLPFFVVGLITSWKKSIYWKLIIASFFLGPLMFGYIGEIHRASRLLPLIPLYALITGSGFLYLWQRKSKILIGILAVFFAINYFDFIHYYLGSYANDTKNIFFCFKCIDGGFKTLKEESKSREFTPYVDEVILKGLNPTRDFAKTIYFETALNSWNGDVKSLLKNVVIMTDNGNVEDLKQINQFDRYYFYIKE